MELEKIKRRLISSFDMTKTYLLNIDFAELPSITLEESKCVKRLPNVECVYFLVGGTREVYYVGKAHDLKERWRNHHCLNRALAVKGLRLQWLALPIAYLAHAEMLLISAFKPKWNVRDVCGEMDYFMRDDPERFADFFK